MASLEEEEDRDLAGSQDGSSDNEIDDNMRDVDDGDGDPDGDQEVDQDQDQDQEDQDQDQDGDDVDQDADSPSNASQTSEGAGMTSQENQNTTNRDSSGNEDNGTFSIYHPGVRPECLIAKTYDILPTTAAPHSTSVNAVTATADMRWVFTGGSDGYLRKFNWADSINSKLMLTVAQRHPFVDSVVKAGVVMTYWENIDGNTLSPVYSLACQSEGLWLLSGLQSGAIRLQTLRHDEGKEVALLRQHTSAVSTLNLTSDEQSLLSGSWDKKVFDWDLNTGQARRAFGERATAGQISALQLRPESSLPVPQDTIEAFQSNGTYSSNYQSNGIESFSFTENHQDIGEAGAVENPQAGSPADSLFGGADSLFGDADGVAADSGVPSGGAMFGVDEDDEFGRAMAHGTLDHADDDADADADADADDDDAPGEVDTMMSEMGSVVQNNSLPYDSSMDVDGETDMKEVDLTLGLAQSVDGLPKAEDMETFSHDQDPTQSMQPENHGTRADTTFLAASIDGTIRVWDRRQPDPVARVTPSRNTPPWCMSACWSPDGNYIYAGRRNGTVEEYSLHKGLRDPVRTFKFPQGSGAVTALRAMPNGRHIVCASHDILRLYDLKHDQLSRQSTTPFLIIPGHRTGTISQLYIDNACRFMISASGNRGWEGHTTEVILGYEIGVPA